MNQTARGLWRLAAVGGAIAVGFTTRDAGLVAITLLGGLALPRILGFGGGHHGMCGGHARHHEGRRAFLEERMAEWHRQAHAGTGPAGVGTPDAGSPA
jgi:hypothetical protein